jgi:cytochrome P450
VPLRKISELPGPRGLPILGNLLQIDSATLHLTAEKWSREYGEYFSFRIGARRYLALANPETIAAVLRDRPEGFNRGQRLVEIAKYMGFSGVFSANGEAWRRQRPMVMASFDPRHIKTYFPALARVTERFEKRWRCAAAAGETIDLQADLMRYTVDVTSGLAFGADINTLESEDEVIQAHLDQIFPTLFKLLLSPFPAWTWFKDRKLEAHLKALHEAVAGFIAQARGRMAADPRLREKPTNLIEAMLAARDNPESGLTDDDVAGNVLTMLLAGEDTTANTLAWMIYLLYRHADALAQARTELLGKDLHRYESMTALPFADACINETMRLKPVAPIIILQPARDTTIADIEVPKDTLLMCLMRAGAIDERRFPDARAFDPGRWLSGASGASPKRVSMPFGAGPRLCPGRYLAILEMKMVMAMLLNNFEIESVRTPDGGEAREHLAFTMYPEDLRLGLREKTKTRARRR